MFTYMYADMVLHCIHVNNIFKHVHVQQIMYVYNTLYNKVTLRDFSKSELGVEGGDAVTHDLSVLLLTKEVPHGLTCLVLLVLCK